VNGGGDRSTVRSVQKAVALLDELARSRRARPAAELAAAVGLDRTVVHRLLRTLKGEGLVREATGRYRLGGRALAYGAAYIDQLALSRAALPYLVDLKATVFPDHPWLVTLSVPVGDVASLIERIWAPGLPLAALGAMGMRLPIAGSAQGRVMLAYYDRVELEAVVGASRAEALQERLQAVREAGGVELARDEITTGISAVAATILSPERRPLGAIGLSGSDLEPHLDRSAWVASRLRQTADQIAARLP
jgi:IclR family transcriptional regulator, acetate operon repressor